MAKYVKKNQESEGKTTLFDTFSAINDRDIKINNLTKEKEDLKTIVDRQKNRISALEGLNEKLTQQRNSSEQKFQSEKARLSAMQDRTSEEIKSLEIENRILKLYGWTSVICLTIILFVMTFHLWTNI